MALLIYDSGTPRDELAAALDQLAWAGSLVVQLADPSWYIQVAKLAGAERYLMEHRAGDEHHHAWTIAHDKDTLLRALLGFLSHDEGWMTGFVWEPLEFDAITGWARLPDHHPMSRHSGVTVEGFDPWPDITDDDW